MELTSLILRARSGDLHAYSALVQATQPMVHAVCYRVLRNSADAADAVQETYLRAFRRMHDLQDPAAFPGWLRRIAVTTSQGLHRKRRTTFLAIENLPVPVLDELENAWSDAKRTVLAAALVNLPVEDRRICDRFYHGGWSLARLAENAGITEPAIRKRLQRIRDRLRKEIEMNEIESTPSGRSNLPARIAELLAKPTLVDLPENPVGAIADALRREFSDYEDIELPEIIDLAQARRVLGQDPVYVPEDTLHRIDANRILRFDLTVPLLLAARDHGTPRRLLAAGKVYRNDALSERRLQAFHQLEILALGDKNTLDPWNFLGSILRALNAILPDSPIRVAKSVYPICTDAWDISLEKDGELIEIAGGGVYNDDVLRFLGADHSRMRGCGLAFGVERVAALKYNIDDLRKLEAVHI